ncbi:MAG TPA: hypothetical protein VMS88_07685 [Terriglobales bacterium]|nr:hypothetical protein [Terriglobales bacterium]
MRSKFPLLVLLLAAGGLLAGCGTNHHTLLSPATPGTGTSADPTRVLQAISLAPQVVDDGQFDADEATTMDGAPAGSLAATHPLRFWRTITHVERSFEFAFADSDTTGRPTTAIVTVHRRLTGTFNILSGVPGTDSVPMDSTLRVIRKPLDDRWVRRLLLHRRPGTDRWRIVATSAVEVTSNNAVTRILSLRVQAGVIDTTITDPLAFFHFPRLFAVDPGSQVTLTVTTSHSDDLVFLVLRGHRFRFHDNGDGTYTGVFPMPRAAALWHAGVNALSHGTLFDDQAPYDSQAWLTPFLVRPCVIASELP